MRSRIPILAPICAMLLLALPTAPARADAVVEPMISIMVDGSNVGSIPLALDAAGIAWVADDHSLSSEGDWAIHFSASLDPDPQIGYVAQVTDFGTPSTFGFSFSLPIVPTPAPGFVTHSFSSNTVDPGGASGTPVTAVAPPAGIPVDGDAITELAVYTLSTDGGLSFLNAGLDLAPSFVGASPTDAHGPFGEGPIAGPAAAGLYDLMRIDVNFSMAGGGDGFGFSGVARVVPEPGTASLVAGGIAALALVPRRRR